MAFLEAVPPPWETFNSGTYFLGHKRTNLLEAYSRCAINKTMIEIFHLIFVWKKIDYEPVQVICQAYYAWYCRKKYTKIS